MDKIQTIILKTLNEERETTSYDFKILKDLFSQFDVSSEYQMKGKCLVMTK